MARLLTALVLALGLGAAVAPATPRPEEAKHPPLYWPTKVGNRLVYIRGQPQNQQEETWEVTKVENHLKGTKVTTEYVRAGGVRAPHQIALLTPAGASLVADNGVAYDPPWHVLKLPHKRGQSWDIPAHPLHGGAGERMAVVGTEVVTVPAGRFETVVVEWQTGLIPSWPRYAFAPGVGLVRLTHANGEPILALKSITTPR